ncbi:hypothetical protein FPSE_01511 [Fusarium pseudograminearum CS3096]|uniref:Uncharacterized protein n=1 Tax=Fusarium pseudograminearum (strain CS3096) TaxID=1028729 RepID=K3W2Q3_FUSPC|nr:hypothetical protein FPSE_01511 [Fusarium pseudograminearum CS3096]EKJ78050.1 hypothetical protein FPSE_01511 [Fusarium pseudograminearum CS3096]
MDTQTTSGSRWVECLLDIDDSIIPGSTLQPIGPGLHVHAKLEMGLYAKPAMKLQFSVRHQSQTHLFAIAIIPLQMILGKPHIADVQTADQVSLHPLLAHQQMGRFEPPRTILTLRVGVSREDIITFKPPSFQQKRNNHPKAVQEIDLKHPNKPVPSTSLFLDGEQQTVPMIGGAIEEITLQNDLASKLWNTAQPDKAIEQENEAKQDTLQERLASVRDNVYTNIAAESLYSRITVPSPAAIEQHAEQPVNVQLAATALDLEAHLRQRHHAKVEMGFIVLNGANRMTESMSLIPMSKYLEASFLLIGDRKTSLFKRIEYSGAIQYRLKSNYRARGHAADFIWKEFYDGQMNIMKKKATPATAAITECLGDWVAPSLSPQLYRDGKLLNAKDAGDHQRGDDEINVRRGTVLIVIPYRAQRSDIGFFLSQEAPHCTTCNTPHATRYCPRFDENAISDFAQDPVTADDGIVRDVFMSRGSGKQDGKRAAF